MSRSPLDFIDANVILRHLLDDHADHSPRATALFEQIERGELQAAVKDTGIFETIFTFEKFQGKSRPAIREALAHLFSLKDLEYDDKAGIATTLDRYVGFSALSYSDCDHAAVMQRLGITTMYSFDRGFDRLPGVTRIEPGEKPPAT